MHPSFRRLVPLVVALLAAAGVPLARAGAQGYRIKLPAFSESVLMDSLRVDNDVHTSPAAVLTAVRSVFKDLGIPATVNDTTAGVVANPKIEVLHAFAGSVLSHWFDCGDSAVGSYADQFRLQIALAIFANPAPGGATRLGIATVASAIDPSGVSRYPKSCGSKGTLEAKLFSLIAKKAGS